mmetsp:Transcript_16681/g.28251  ORF Transcript_16681/g.28251 Transcript_16681/m.28251 type:complete len:1262 (-) Transcript_16681:1911-5696(-)
MMISFLFCRTQIPIFWLVRKVFFLADLIQSQDNSNSFYVGLKKNSIAGMLATSLDINVSLIMKIFDIDAFPDIIIAKEERPLPPPLLISVMGDLRLVDIVAVEEAVRDLNCIFVNAETMDLPLSDVASAEGGEMSEGKEAESKDALAEGEEKKDSDPVADGQENDANPAPIGQKESPLKLYLDKLLQDHLELHQFGDPPSAIVMFGYPRSENEAYDRLQEMIFSFDYIVEVHNTSEDAEEDEEDEFLQHHLDALEVLREQYFSGEGKAYVAHHAGHHHQHHDAPQLDLSHAQHKVSWRKVSVTSNEGGDDDGGGGAASMEAVTHLNNDLARIMDHRNAKIEAQRAKDNEEPPQANAFAITVFCMTHDYLSRGEDIIKIAFEDHPNHDYCLYMVPNDRHPPTEITSHFSYVKTRPGISFDQSLYVMHRSSFLVNDFLSVKRMTEKTLHDVSEFAESLQDQTSRVLLIDAMKTTLEYSDVELKDNPNEVCFVVKLGETVVGTIIVSRKTVTNEDVAWFRMNYHIDELVNYERHRVRNQAIITSWTLDPAYSPFSRRILQIIMRQYGKTLLYFHTEKDVVPPKEIAEEFVPLKPRRLMQAGGNVKVELEQRPAKSLSAGGLSSDCPLYCITKHFLSHPKDMMGKRVVVIGGSSHSYALLNTLCSIPFINLPNIYLVLEKPPAPLRIGQEYEEESKFDDDYSGCFSMQDDQYPFERELYAMGLGHKVNLVEGHLTDIDRENKAVVVSDKIIIEYDILVISTATQDSSTMSISTISHLHPAQCADAGIFSLGNPSADILALKYIRKRYPSRSDDVVVAGSGLPVFAAVAKLLKIGIDPMRITLVEREEEGRISGLKEKAITDPLMKAVLSVGVKMCWGFKVADVHMSRTGFLEGVELTRSQPLPRQHTPPTQGRGPRSESKAAEPEEEESNLVLACMALLCCTTQQCDRDVFNTVVDSGLVFDGGLVVDTNFRTVDPAIYALSDFTRFSRVYKDALPHNKFNPLEVGSFVALKILESQIGRTAPSMDRPYDYANTSRARSSLVSAYVGPNRTNRPPLPTFQLPRGVSSDMPGGLHYFSSRLPSIPVEATSYLTNGQSSQDAFLTANARNRNCLLKTDYHGTVVEFTYLGEDAVENRNLGLLTGMNEAYLNSAVHCHSKGYVADWIEFFRREWATALYQDRFPMLVQSVRHNLADDKGMSMILTRVFERAETAVDDQEVAEFRREFLGPHGELAPEATNKHIQAEAVEFLKENHEALPHYYLPPTKS